MNRSKRLDIQALRAIAVLAVVIYHFWPGSLTGGFMGVDIFFVISGYLMTTTLMRDAQPVLKAKNKFKATWSYLTNFYARRIKRLVPAAAVTLLAILVLVYATGNLALIQQTAYQVFTSALFVQNWQLARDSVDYLANTDPTAVQHFWSLSLEEQFYLVWPLALLIILLITANFLIVYKKKKEKKSINMAIVPTTLLVAGFFVYGYYLTQTQSSLAYFVTPARVWELLLGGIIAFLPVLKNYDLRLLLPWVGAAMIAYSTYKWGGEGFPGWHALVPTIGTTMIIYAGTLASESKWSFENMLRFRPIQWLGNLSYSLYLWHWPLIILLPVLFFIDLDSHPQGLLIKLAILILSLVIAQLSYRFIEQKTQHAAVKKRYVYIAFFAITALVAGLGFYLSNRVESDIKSAVNEVRAAAFNNDECLGSKAILNKCDLSYGHVENRYSQIAFNDKYDYILSNGTVCASYDAQSYNDRITTYCQVGDLNAKRQITVWGDSHAQHWINPMDEIGRRHHIKVNIIGTSNCFGSEKYQENCDIRFDSIKKSGVLDDSSAILVSMLHSARLKSPGNNSVNALNRLSSMTKNPNVYMLEDVPFAGATGGPDCSVLRQTCKNSVENATGPIKKESAELIDLKLIRKDHVISTKELFCDSTYCYSNIGGVQVYRDKTGSSISRNMTNSHMTASFAYSTWPMLEQKLKDKGILE
jgi:peptidoglycan/LPS O-acetylase OafA/YrhL